MNELVFVLNGSNLNMLGKREPHLYGTTTLPRVQQEVEALASRLELACEFRQTNSEATMVDWLQEAFERDAGVIINPAGFSFASVPVLDAVKLVQKPLIELHITNIHKRDETYRHSLVSKAAMAVICGLGVDGYLVAMQAMATALRKNSPFAG
ncbi:3-dehydroquinate dehydratase [Caballeronia arationis]|jgi:3-dehydroquinate dehydratase-2|uniref:3-dehydroquinate dehydratase n=1 Tax=Caballeronia arationis TaxID=1777142 RepID=A0A7Z7N296_9BURK|nr:type II 3-dehydroquinate dehydratase [Caballeronia arationis]SAK99677.1 3-dehydroquinate dehydratase [Caballeronia arationis]SOE64997.1 3-dehydroquinate dehydratase [Caballeronia arationis]